MELIRLQKYIAESGITSRRKAEELIRCGRVKVNGLAVTEMGVKINPEADEIEVDGTLIKPEAKKYYIMLNKPAGYITTTSDDFDRPTVMELTSDVHARIYPVGRLDYDTQGLLLLSNDGNFANAIMHPGGNLKKTYIANVKGLISISAIKKLKSGVDIGDYFTRPAEAEIISGTERESTVKITIGEGRKRQVRRMLEAVGYPVLRLKRVQIGAVMLGNLPEGKWRHLKAAEIDLLTKGKAGK
ncbi:MAG: rRNA pseudouridine synthase [Ruminococcaceae bacterium]|nr:rRNA pseudouridine synthase [Oscillospiraceae bacterium]